MSTTLPLPSDAAHQLPALRASFADATRDPERFAARFYQHLFELAPALRPMFPADLKPQQKKLLQALGLLVSSLERPATIAQALRQLGERHAAYGVQVKHYAIVGQVLVDTLAELASTPLDAPLRTTWASVYGWVAATMLDGALAARPATERLAAAG